MKHFEFVNSICFKILYKYRMKMFRVSFGKIFKYKAKFITFNSWKLEHMKALHFKLFSRPFFNFFREVSKTTKILPNRKVQNRLTRKHQAMYTQTLLAVSTRHKPTPSRTRILRSERYVSVSWRNWRTQVQVKISKAWIIQSTSINSKSLLLLLKYVAFTLCVFFFILTLLVFHCALYIINSFFIKEIFLKKPLI